MICMTLDAEFDIELGPETKQYRHDCHKSDYRHIEARSCALDLLKDLQSSLPLNLSLRAHVIPLSIYNRVFLQKKARHGVTRQRVSIARKVVPLTKGAGRPGLGMALDQYIWREHKDFTIKTWAVYITSNESLKVLLIPELSNFGSAANDITAWTLGLSTSTWGAPSKSDMQSPALTCCLLLSAVLNCQLISWNANASATRQSLQD